MKIDDPVFGPLEYSGYDWEGSVYLEAFQKTLRLEIMGTEAYPPEDDERAVFTAFLERQHEFKAALERAVFDYYVQNLELHRNWYSTPEEAEKCVPSLSETSEVWTQIEPLRIDVGSSEWGEISLRLAFNTRWDKEHGIDATLFDEKFGIAEGGANWVDQTHYDLTGTPL